MTSLLDGRDPEVHGGLLWGTWCCTCEAGGSAWSSASAGRALRRHVRAAHDAAAVPPPREG